MNPGLHRVHTFIFSLRISNCKILLSWKKKEKKTKDKKREEKKRKRKGKKGRGQKRGREGGKKEEGRVGKTGAVPTLNNFYISFCPENLIKGTHTMVVHAFKTLSSFVPSSPFVY